MAEFCVKVKALCVLRLWLYWPKSSGLLHTATNHPWCGTLYYFNYGKPAAEHDDFEKYCHIFMACTWFEMKFAEDLLMK